MVSCGDDDGIESNTTIDEELTQAIQAISPTSSVDYFKLPDPSNLGDTPQDPLNPLTNEKVALGKLMFHETELGGNPNLAAGLKTFGCASCHHAASGFQAGIAQGIGEGGSGFGLTGEGRTVHADYDDPNNLDIQPIRTPPALNVAFQDVMLWNGQFGATGTNAGTEANWTPNTPIETNTEGFEGVETQAIAGFNVHRLQIDQQFLDDLPTYKEMLDDAFPNMDEARKYSNIGVGLAVAAYERTLLPTEAPFQRWLSGQTEELSVGAKRGALVFFGKGECYTCHTGPALNDKNFHAIGMEDLDALNTDASNAGFVSAVLGRGGFTKNAADEYKFKTPQLYNLKDHRFFGHGATFQSIEDVLRYKNDAVVEKASLAGHSNISQHFKPLNLTDAEITDLVDFLENGLYDPSLDRYSPTSLPSGNCFPVNDTQSKADLGCD